MPEVAFVSSIASAPNTAVLQRSPSKLNNAFAGYSRTHSGETGGEMDIDEDVDTKTMSEKQRLLGQYLNNVSELVQDLEESAPFGVVVA